MNANDNIISTSTTTTNVCYKDMVNNFQQLYTTLNNNPEAMKKVINLVSSVLKYYPKYENTKLRNMIQIVVTSGSQINDQYLANFADHQRGFHSLP